MFRHAARVSRSEGADGTSVRLLSRVTTLVNSEIIRSDYLEKYINKP